MNRVIVGATPIDGFLDAWALTSPLDLDEIVVVGQPASELLETFLERIRPGGVLRVVSDLPWPALEIRMLEGGWSTIVPTRPGITIFGEKPDDGSTPPICGYDDDGLTLVEGRR